MGHWSELPRELLESILEHLTNIFDQLRFSSVCSSWRSVSLARRKPLAYRLPFMLLPTDVQSEIGFFSPSTNKVYHYHLPEFHRRWCCGSSKGWLITVDYSSWEVHLLNQFSRTQIQLPSLNEFPNIEEPGHYNRKHDNRYLRKAILSSNPNSTTDYIVMAIGSQLQNLSYCKPGDKKWTNLQSHWDPFEDVISYLGMFYVLAYSGAVLACNINFDATMTEITPATKRSASKRYLVESSGKLLMVLKYLEWEGSSYDWTCKTSRFEVLRLEQRTQKWIEMANLGEQMLFVAPNCCMSLSSCNIPQCRGNCIYFIDECHTNETGIFNLENGKIELFGGNCPYWLTSPAIWVKHDPWE